MGHDMCPCGVMPNVNSSSFRRHPTRMMEPRHINHLAAAAVSQTFSAAPAEDTHQLRLKGCDRRVKRPNVSKTSKRTGRKGRACACVRRQREIKVENRERGGNQRQRRSVW